MGSLVFVCVSFCDCNFFKKILHKFRMNLSGRKDKDVSAVRRSGKRFGQDNSMYAKGNLEIA